LPWYWICLGGPENIEAILASAVLLRITRTGHVAVGCVRRPFASDRPAAPALVACLDACILVVETIARVLALGNRESGISALIADELFEDWPVWPAGLAAKLFPCGWRRPQSRR
jgi:hypothetical protein